MHTSARRSSLIAILAVATLATTLCGCNLMGDGPTGSTVRISEPQVPPSALTVVVEAADPGTITQLRSLLKGTARPKEHLAVIGSAGSAVSSVTPGSTSLPAPHAPRPLPAGATTYQRAEHQHAVVAYQSALSSARDQVARTTRDRLDSWVRGLRLGTVQPAGEPVETELEQAGGTFASLAQAGLGLSTRKTLVLLGNGSGMQLLTQPVGGLQGATVIVTGVSGDATVVAQWQAALLATGAARTVVLGPATVDELEAVTAQGLGGTVTDTLADAGLFSEGSATLLPQASPQLSQIAHLLSVTYPDATATVIGLCDPVGGDTINALLAQQRAAAVVSALEAMGVPSERLEPIALGDADPAAPPGPGGIQPLDRRVLVVIEPSG
ncbi:MAG: OmpA family protein [Acidimicrobiales bacterium]|nr:OmpA family protein [Acidimicrobiales bacterium]